MASLADIWDTPAESVSSHAPSATPVDGGDDEPSASIPRRSTARPRSTLFLDSDSDNEGLASTSGGAHYAKRPSTSKPDIDALWDDLDEEPETAFKQLAPSLDVDALKRQADEHIALTPHQILPSSSPPRDLGDGDDKEGGKEKKTKKGEKINLRKKKRPVLDEGRLVGPDGFPALMKQAKVFKPKGKGHELSDLSRLMNVYHFWTHQMYPNTQFVDTVQRVERLCHSKRLTVALRAWHDESKGLINGLNVPDGADHSDNESSSDDDHDAAPLRDLPIATEDERSSPARSRGPSLPPSSASEAGAFDDDFDIDAMIREEESARASSSARPGPGPGPGSGSGPSKQRAPPADEEEEEMMMWDEMMMATDLPDEPFAPPDRAPAPAADEDAEMWDMVHEIEMEADAKAKEKEKEKEEDLDSGAAAAAEAESERASSPVTGPSGMVGVDPTRPPSNDEGWEEMYA